MAKNSHENWWSDADYGFLADNPHLSSREVGEILGRSSAAVTQMRHRIARGYVRKLEPWSKEDIEYVRMTRHMTAEDVASNLGRTYAWVTQRRRELVSSEGLSFAASGSPFQIGSRRLLAKTCPTCGRILSARDFGAAKSKGNRNIWKSSCQQCRYENQQKRPIDRAVEANQKYLARMQAVTLAQATRNGYVWLEADHLVLRDSDLTLIEKAILLKRTYLAVQQACKRSGYISRVGMAKPEFRGEWKIDNPNARNLLESLAS